MKITYTPNPLNSIVELDPTDFSLLWYKVKVNELEELLYNAYFHLDKTNYAEYFDVAQSLKSLDPNYYLDEDVNGNAPIDVRVDMIMKYYVEELKSSHEGDCTSIACSCTKCQAERVLGIDTIPGLSKSGGNNIASAFGNNRTIDEALEYLKSYKFIVKDEDREKWDKLGGYEQYVPRWEAEKKQAYEWLSNYKITHNF